MNVSGMQLWLTTFTARTLDWLITTGLSIALVIAVALVAARVYRIAVGRMEKKIADGVAERSDGEDPDEIRQRIRTLGTAICIFDPFGPGHQRGALLGTLRIANADRCPGAQQRGHDGQRRRIAHVVGVGLEGHPEDANGSTRQLAIHCIADLLDHGALAGIVHGNHRLDDAHRATVLLADPRQRMRQGFLQQILSVFVGFAQPAGIAPGDTKHLLAEQGFKSCGPCAVLVHVHRDAIRSASVTAVGK